jgi:hypothetical protein
MQKLTKWFTYQAKEFHNWLCRLCWKFIQTSEIKIPTSTSSLPNLCPTSYAEGIEAYENRLTELLNNKEHRKVTEIAITSPYSGGKSSLIDTYIRKHPYHKYTNISLADFKISDDIQDADELDKTKLVQQIEKSIVQQILYRVKDSEMPNSRFRKIVMNKPSWHWLLAQPLGFLIFLISIALILFPTTAIASSLDTLFATIQFKEFVSLFSTMYLFIFPCLLLKDIYRYFNKFSVSKLNLLKGEVTLDSNNNDSIFNLHIEEIIYYFAGTKSNVVIFEDLDRFDKPQIFIKLKEINKLINDSKEVNQRVCFIYALKDEVFNGSNRTKFFDAIIPIVPITNSVNSYPRLKALLKDAELLDGISDEYLRDVAIYIEDMRMLKNIVTEYGIYKLTLNDSLKKPEFFRLFSFIIYKNVYCADFSKLQVNQGLLANFFNSKRVLQQTLVQNIQTEIDELESVIDAIDAEELKSIEELNAVYLYTIINNLPHDNVWQIHNHSLRSIVSQDVFDAMWANKQNISFRFAQNSSGNAGAFSSFNTNFTPSYTQRKRLISEKKNHQVIKNTKHISNLKRQQKRCQSSSVKDLMKLLPKDDVFSQLLSNKDKKSTILINKNKLLIHLLEKGYIDEMYHVYISHFLEGHITKGDMAFVLKVKSNEPCDSSDSLTNLNEICKYLNSDDYHNQAVFNYNLINYLLEEGELTFVEMIVNMVKSSPSTFNEDSIYLSLEYISDKAKWLSVVVQEWSSFWKEVISSEELNQAETSDFLVKLMVNLYDSKNNVIPVPPEDIAFVLDHINSIENLSHFLPDNTNEYSKLIESLKYLSVSFESFTVEAESSRFIDDIIEYHLFDINRDNYCYLVSFITQQPVDDIELSLSAFCDADNGKLLNSINKHINDFVSEVFLDESFVIGSEESTLFLLNHSELSVDLKESIIHDKELIVNCISVISDKLLWSTLLNQQKVKPDWINIMSCLSVGKAAYSALIDYLNRENTIELLTQGDESKNIHELGEYLDEFIQLLLNKSLNLISFSKYCSLLKESLVETNFSEFSAEKIEILIEKHFIEFDEDNYNSLSEYHPDSVVRFIECEFDQAVKTSIYSDLFFNEDEMEVLLNSDLITIGGKLNVSFKLDESTTSISSDLFELYSCLYVNQQAFKIPAYILKFIINFKSGDISKRVTLLATQIDFISKEFTFELIGCLGWAYTKLSTTGSWCKINKNRENKLLASALENQGYFSISKSSIYSDEIRLDKKK